MKRLLGALFAAALSAAPAFGQAILQGGAFTPGHVPMYTIPGSAQPIVQDSGTAAGGGVGLGLSELLMSVRSATNSYPAANAGTGPLNANFCNYDGPTTGAYHYLCMSPNAQGGGLIAYGFGGGASSLPFTFNINGTAYQFPFTTTGVIGPGSSVVNDIACWNNTAGTLLKDCGGLVSLSANNTWTGTNNFTSTFQILGTAQTFPASGLLVGQSDVQTLTNKSISAGQINSGTLGCLEMPALTGNVTSSAGGCGTTIGNSVVTNAMLAAASAANTVKGAATSTTVTDLTMPSCSVAGNALQWLTGTGFQCATITGQSAGWGLTGTSTFSISTSAPPFGFDMPVNMSLSASAAASALTITVVAADTGSSPTATHPVLMPFRSKTTGNGTANWTAVTSALSITIPSGATLGTTNNIPFRLWIFAEYNSGTPELGVATCSSATQIYNCSSWEPNLVTSTTISGLATSLGVLYATTGVSNDAVRMIGFCDFTSGLSTVGSWSSSCNILQPFGPGIKKPGDTIQVLYTSATSGNSLTLSMAPTSSVNLVRFNALLNASCTASNNLTYTAKRGATTLLSANIFEGTSAAGLLVPLGPILDAPGTTSSTAYSSNYSCTGLSTSNSTLEIQEIMGALEPANDNAPLEMTG